MSKTAVTGEDPRPPGRRRRRAGAGREAGRALAGTAVPPWLVEVVRPARAPVPWTQMLRALLAVVVPLAAGLAAGRPVPGLLIATGGLLGAIIDRGGPYPMRVRRITCAAVFGGAPGLIIGELIHGRGWITVAALVVVAGVSALMSAVSDIASLAGLQLLVYAAFSTGPLGALRPAWLTPVLFLAGVGWFLLLLAPGWLAHPQRPERGLVAQVYQALAGLLQAAGTGSYPAARQQITAALNEAYDALLSDRRGFGGRNAQLARLMALLNQASLLSEAGTALALTGQPAGPGLVTAVEGVAASIRHGTAPPRLPGRGPARSAAEQACWDRLAGAVRLAGGRAPEARPGPPGRAGGWARLGARLERIRQGPLVWLFTARLMLCIGLAALCSEVLPLQRSYWVVLTVAIVLKPDFGSVFARALQRGLGTVIGAVAGALILAAVPYGPLLLIPLAVLAALLPYGRTRNYGLMSAFLTPLIVLLIDLLTRTGWRLAEVRLADTLLGCLIVLVAGYAIWPMSWHAHLPRQLASAIRKAADYTGQALAGSPGGPGGRNRYRRQAYRALSDLRAEFQRTMAEPPFVSRQATAWWPAVVALEQLMDAVTAAAVSFDGAGPPPPGQVAELTRVLRALPAVIDPAAPATPPPGCADLPDGLLEPVSEAVRAVRSALSGSTG